MPGCCLEQCWPPTSQLSTLWFIVVSSTKALTTSQIITESPPPRPECPAQFQADLLDALATRLHFLFLDLALELYHPGEVSVVVMADFAEGVRGEAQGKRNSSWRG